MRYALPCLFALLSACTDMPGLVPGSAGAALAPYPALLTHAEVLAATGAADPADDPQAHLAARAAALKARTAALKRAGMTDADRARLSP